MSYLIPSWDIPLKDRKLFRRVTAEAMIHRALLKGFASNRSQLRLRDLMRRDVGLTSWRTPPQLPNEVTPWIKMEVPLKSIFSVYKVIQISLNPKVSTLSARLGYSGANTVAIHELDKLYGILPLLKKLREYGRTGFKQIIYGIDNLKMEGYFSEPIVLTSDDFFSLEVCSPEGNRKGDMLVLGGFVVEPAGLTIS